jgi:hypothetical protein
MRDRTDLGLVVHDMCRGDAGTSTSACASRSSHLASLIAPGVVAIAAMAL